MKTYTVNTIWDPEAEVWVATSCDIGGLVLESGSFDALIEKIKYAVPELLELNMGDKVTALPLSIKTERTIDIKVG